MSAKFNQLKDWYERYERRIATGSLLFGFVFDSLTLQRIDALRENLWIALNLLVVGTCIVLLNKVRDEKYHFWLLNILQFGFGALLGAFFIFYFRSATLAAAWPFLLLLLAAMVANELFVKRYARLTFQVSFFYLSLFSFSIFLLPLILRRIGPFIFLLSGLASLLIIWLFFRALKRSLWRPIIFIFIIINLLYFTNLIPPIPLSLQDAGIYHSLRRDAASDSYVVAAEKKGFFDRLRVRETVHLLAGESLYAYSAVFSPASLDTGIVHEWQYRNDEGEWATATRVPLFLSGGREGGFRTYSAKSNLAPGLWRVNVETPRGALIGRVSFRVVSATSRVPLVYSVKK